MAATLASTLIGFSREVINARFYGTRWEMDTFLVASIVPTIMFGLLNGALVSALVPVFSEYVALERDAEGQRLMNTIVNGLTLLLVVGTVLGWLLAPYYVPLIAHGFPAPQTSVAIRMTRWLMPTVIATSLAGVFSAWLNVHRKFAAAALQGVVINIITISVVFLLDRKLGIYAVVLGTTIGFCAAAVVQAIAFLRLGSYRFELDLRHPGLARVWQMFGPIVVGSAAGQTALFFDRFFASTLPPGAISALNYANKLVGFPQQIFAVAIATVIFPLLSAHFAKRNGSGIRRSVSTGLRLANFITIPAVCGLIALAGPIVQTLFERGSFTAEATVSCVALLPYAAFGLIALAANVILSRCCFACNSTRWPVVISICTVLLNVILSLVWLPHLGARGLLLANTVSQTCQALALGTLAWHLVGGFNLREFWRSTARIVIASATMTVILEWIVLNSALPGPSFGSRAIHLAGELLIGIGSFIAIARALRVSELDLALKLIVDKFRRHVPSVTETQGAPIA